MNDPKPPKDPAPPYVRYTTEQLARNKKDHDARRKAIRQQNARSKMVK
jgi:hypothetical protein